jgi:alpha-N-arabinofuranosidase
MLRGLFVVGGSVALSGCSTVLSATPGASRAETVNAGTIVMVDASQAHYPVSSGLTGVNLDEWYNDAHGLWDSQHNSPNPDVMAKVQRSGIGLIRYPGGTSANLFHWKNAIGPQQQRGYQVSGSPSGEPEDSRFGPDEFMRVMQQLEAEPQIMAGFANTTPQEIADWVAYMNAPQGTQWGDLRAKNGHPQPYGVRRWEIGNEPYVASERYWLSSDANTALQQYVFGGTQRQQRQPLGTPSDHRKSAGVSNDAPNQQFTVWYPPVAPHSQTIYVDGVGWHEIADLATARAADQVYTLDPATGTVRFGDGRHGAIPPRGAEITADYDSGPHAGFVDYYTAMKMVDPTIEVYAVWTPIAQGKLQGTTFPQFMAEHGVADKYDGVSIHPYTDFSRDLGIKEFASRVGGHNDMMVGEAAATNAVSELLADVQKNAKGKASVAVSECGALWFDKNHHETVYPQYSYSMSHVLYAASQWSHYANLGLDWVVTTDLISESPGITRAVLSSTPEFVYSADAVVREQLSPVVHGGGHVVQNAVRNNVTINAGSTQIGSSYDALVTTATVDQQGTLNLVVVNRSADKDVMAQVDTTGFASSGAVEISTVSGSAYDSFNDTNDLSAVKIVRSQQKFQNSAISQTFGAHSVVLLQVTRG